MDELSSGESAWAVGALEERLSRCFNSVVLPGETPDPGGPDRIFVAPGSSITIQVELHLGAGRELAFELNVRDDGSGVLSNGSWAFSFGHVRETDLAGLAATAIRDSCVAEVMCS